MTADRRQVKTWEDVFFFFPYQPGRALIVLTTTLVQGFAVYEIFLNHHFVWSSESLSEKHKVLSFIFLETNISGFPKISQLVNGKDHTINQLFWFQIATWSTGKISVPALLGSLARKPGKLQQET